MKFKERFDAFIKDCKRVLKISKKPNKEEYLSFSKVTTIGIIVIGLVGFVIVLIGQLIHL